MKVKLPPLSPMVCGIIGAALCTVAITAFGYFEGNSLLEIIYRATIGFVSAMLMLTLMARSQNKLLVVILCMSIAQGIVSAPSFFPDYTTAVYLIGGSLYGTLIYAVNNKYI